MPKNRVFGINKYKAEIGDSSEFVYGGSKSREDSGAGKNNDANFDVIKRSCRSKTQLSEDGGSTNTGNQRRSGQEFEAIHRYKAQGQTGQEGELATLTSQQRKIESSEDVKKVNRYKGQAQIGQEGELATLTSQQRKVESSEDLKKVNRYKGQSQLGVEGEYAQQQAQKTERLSRDVDECSLEDAKKMSRYKAQGQLGEGAEFAYTSASQNRNKSREDLVDQSFEEATRRANRAKGKI